MTAPAAFDTAPDHDSVRTVKAAAFRWSTTYRLRIWREARLVVVTELDANDGASVTNAIEAVARDAEIVLRSSLMAEPGTLPFEDGWSLCEHYEHERSADTFDRVRFAPRQSSDALPFNPRWSPWLDSEVVR